MLIYNRADAQGEKIMTIKFETKQPERKFNNGDVIICTTPTAYNFTKIIIRRKEKANKKDTGIKYLCSVFIKDSQYASSWIITEQELLNIQSGLEDK